MGIWDSARRGLARAAVNHLGELLTLAEADSGPGSVDVRGILTRAESVNTLGHSSFVMADAMLAMKTVDAPAWMARGVTVTAPDSGEVFRVTEHTDNGEGVTEVILCRSS